VNQDNSQTTPERPELPAWVSALRSSDGLFVTDEDQRIVAWTPSAEAALGHRAADVIGRRCYEVIAGTDICSHPVCRPGCTAVTNASRGRTTASYDVAALDSDGQRVWVNNSIMLSREDAGGGPLLIHLFRRRKAPPSEQPAAEPSQPRPRMRGPARRGGLQPLSRRELETLRMLAAGQTTAEIADALTISRYTARNHINNLLRKLGARNRIEGLLLAAERHLI
jgi:PAS domain S-box-containing protein